MSTQTMDYPIPLDHTTQSTTTSTTTTTTTTTGTPTDTNQSAEPMDYQYHGNNVEITAASPAVDDTTCSGNNKSEPSRGVKKTPSLRRGAAVYAELLQSAVKASIESQQKENPPPEISFPPNDPTGVADSPINSVGGRNKRTNSEDYHQEYQEVPIAPRKKASRTDIIISPETPQQTAFSSPRIYRR